MVHLSLESTTKHTNFCPISLYATACLLAPWKIRWSFRIKLRDPNSLFWKNSIYGYWTMNNVFCFLPIQASNTGDSWFNKQFLVQQPQLQLCEFIFITHLQNTSLLSKTLRGRAHRKHTGWAGPRLKINDSLSCAADLGTETVYNLLSF
jgi:hypothetical protein